jgi:hypothetical protein
LNPRLLIRFQHNFILKINIFWTPGKLGLLMLRSFFVQTFLDFESKYMTIFANFIAIIFTRKIITLAPYLANVAVDVEVLLHGHHPDSVGGALDGGDPLATGGALGGENSEKGRPFCFSQDDLKNWDERNVHSVNLCSVRSL